MKFPDFIIVGCMKCGTTVMWYNMNNHPDITMGKNWDDPKKTSTEIRFWNNGKPHKNYKKGFEWYKNLFKGNFCGEKCANYIESSKAMQLMSKYIPNLKIIINIRNPIDRAYSEYQMAKHTRKLKIPFKKIIKQKPAFIEKSKYFKMIKKNVLPYFKKENIYISIQERMKNNTEKELNKIYKFLGVKEININTKEVTHDEKDKTINGYKKWTSNYEELDLKMRKKLQLIFKPENKKLFKFLGYKIDEWNNK